jgi:hypothetical protein
MWVSTFRLGAAARSVQAVTGLSRFLVELERPDLPGAEVQALADRSRAVAAQMRGEGASLRYLRTIYVPEDGRCFLLFEGGSAVEVSEAGRRAGLAPRGVVEAIKLDAPGP